MVRYGNDPFSAAIVTVPACQTVNDRILSEREEAGLCDSNVVATSRMANSMLRQAQTQIGAELWRYGRALRGTVLSCLLTVIQGSTLCGI